MVTLKCPAGRRAREDTEHDGDENGLLDEQNYVQALGTDNMEGDTCLQALHIVYLLTFCSSSLRVCKDIFLLNFDFAK